MLLLNLLQVLRFQFLRKEPGFLRRQARKLQQSYCTYDEGSPKIEAHCSVCIQVARGKKTPKLAIR